MDKKVICFGEVLWDDFGETKTIGGAPLNVCYHLSKLNVVPLIVSQVGKDLLGGQIVDQIDQWGIDGRYLRQVADYPTSTVKVELHDKGNVTYEIIEKVAWDFLCYDARIADEIKNAQAFVYGTLAARSEMSRSVLLRYLEDCRWPVLDLNLRPPYTDPEVVVPLIRACKTIKLNLEELYALCKFCEGTYSSEQEAVSLVLDHFDNIKEIVLTKGAEGAAYYNRDEYLFTDGITVEVKDTVGSGDSFLAAFINGRLSGESNREALRDATVLSAFIATQTGGCPPYTLKDIEQFKNLMQ